MGATPPEAGVGQRRKLRGVVRITCGRHRLFSWRPQLPAKESRKRIKKKPSAKQGLISSDILRRLGVVQFWDVGCRLRREPCQSYAAEFVTRQANVVSMRRAMILRPIG